MREILFRAIRKDDGGYITGASIFRALDKGTVRFFIVSTGKSCKVLKSDGINISAMKADFIQVEPESIEIFQALQEVAP